MGYVWVIGFLLEAGRFFHTLVIAIHNDVCFLGCFYDRGKAKDGGCTWKRSVADSGHLPPTSVFSVPTTIHTYSSTAYLRPTSAFALISPSAPIHKERVRHRLRKGVDQTSSRLRAGRDSLSGEAFFFRC